MKARTTKKQAEMEQELGIVFIPNEEKALDSGQIKGLQ